MASFFEKLKRGMGAEEPAEEEITEEPGLETKEEKKKAKRPPKQSKFAPGQVKKIEIGEKIIEMEAEETEEPETEKEEIEVKKESWSAFGGEPEGQLAIDVYQTDSHLVIQSAIAGVKPEDLDVLIENDVVAIRGKRERSSEDEEKNYFYQECYWGPFSREIILPEEVDPSRAEAEMREGILTVRIPKIERQRKRQIIVKG